MAKTVAYTPEQTFKLISAYKESPTTETVNSFAVKFGKTVKSVVAKLSREGVYKKAEYTTKSGDKPESKKAIADEIGNFLKMDEGNISSLTKANKKALVMIRDTLREAFKPFVEIEPETETETEITE
jgi:hypothetical protein